MTIIKKHCERCRKIIPGNKGFYIQIYQRSNRGNRENGFVCDKCIEDLEKFFEGDKNASLSKNNKDK